MKAADLIVLASAHGIDISHTVASETNTRGAAARRKRTREERLHGVPIRDTVQGKQTLVYRPREWTHAETGMGGAGVKRMPWLAVEYSVGGDYSGYFELHRGLTATAMHLAERNRWPWKIATADGREDYYHQRLAELVLDEDRFKRAFNAAPGLYAIYMRVTPEVWSKPLWGYFCDLQCRYQRWLDSALGSIQARCRDSVATEDAVA